MKKILTLCLFVLALRSTHMAANNCSYVNAGATMLLQGDCTTDAPIVIPNGMTHDGQGNKITAVDPGGGHFVGGILQNGGSLANVVNTVLETVGLSNVCDAGANRLRAILFDGASGSILNNTVLAVNQNPSPGVLSGCQEGNAIEVRNFGTFPGNVQVVIDGNVMSNYQKTGIVVNGAAVGAVTNNVVLGAGPQPNIAQNGIQIGFGAVANVQRNVVNGNSYSGTSTVSGGILLVAGSFYGSAYSVGDVIQNNTLMGNDVGIFSSQLDAGGNPPATQTNVKMNKNVIFNGAVTNGYVYQAGISDQGNNNKMVSNTITGAGYNQNDPCGCLFKIDNTATIKDKTQANK